MKLWGGRFTKETNQLVHNFNASLSFDQKFYEEAMNAVGLDPKDRRHYKKYSLGMKERLGIAQAILKKPKLILLDEPTNGIDSDGIQMLEELLWRLKEEGSTIVVTSHDRDFLDAVTSQCYEMKEGSLRRECV